MPIDSQLNDASSDLVRAAPLTDQLGSLETRESYDPRRSPWPPSGTGDGVARPAGSGGRGAGAAQTVECGRVCLLGPWFDAEVV